MARAIEEFNDVAYVLDKQKRNPASLLWNIRSPELAFGKLAVSLFDNKEY